MSDHRVIPGKERIEDIKPYLLDDNSEISLPLLSEILKNCCSTIKQENIHIHVSFVFSSGREIKSMGQIGLICDALFVPEICGTLSTTLNNCSLHFKSYLDIDIYNNLEPDNNLFDGDDRPNIIICGTGDINCVAAEVFQFYLDKDIHIRPGQSSPYYADPIGYKSGLRYSPMTCPNGAYLTAIRNPWCGDRIIIICGGIFGVGTVAALWLLNEYLKGNGNKYGNNYYNNKVPGKIIEGIPNIYERISLKATDELIPPHDIRNLEITESPVKIIE